jgi:CSLREA domain-containing protein
MPNLQRFVTRSLALQLALNAVAAHAANTYVVTSDADPVTGSAANCPGPSCTLRDAIAAAVGGDTITFDPAISTIPLQNALILTDTTGTIAINGGGTVTVDGGNHGIAIFSLLRSTVTTITGLKIQNGICGLFNQGTVELDDSTVSGNSGRNYGGIYSNGTLTLNNSMVSGNSATNGSGGGIVQYDGATTLNNSTVSGNSATNGSGGGIYCLRGTVTINSSTVSGNASTGAGGGISSGACRKLTLNNSTVSGNVAQNATGGGVYASVLAGYVFSLTSSTVSGNNGGAVFVTGPGNANLTNSTVVSVSGPAFAVASTATLRNATIFGPVSNYGTLRAANAIFAGPCIGSPTATITDNGGNLGSDASCLGTTPSGAGSKSNANLALSPLLDNGGPTRTLMPAAGSDAIGAGVASVCSSAPVGGVDQRGVTRPQGAVCDSGAVERKAQEDRLFYDGFEARPDF